MSCFSSESGSAYSVALSRMEREWLNKEYPQESDEVRISRLEEKVFGTIHDIDTKTRYSHLRQAFDTKKMMQGKRSSNYLYGNPTSIPMNVDGLLGY